MHPDVRADTDTPVVETEPPDPPSVHSALGTARCDGIGCAATTGIQCAFVDRRGRACPTAWCPSHRAVVDDAVHCCLHAATLSGTRPAYADTLRPDLDDRLPALVGWIAGVAEDDVVAALQEICRDRGEVVVADPVRRLLLGTLREPTWERAWKTCSADGVGARVAIAVDEAEPDDVLAKVNHQVVARLSTPRDHKGEEPSAEVVELLVRQLVLLIAMALDRWQQEQQLEVEEQPDAEGSNAHVLVGVRAPAAAGGRV